MTFPLQKTEELGLDRPTFIWAVNLSYRGDRGASAEPGDLTSVYGTVPGRWLPMAAAARGAGLAEERDGRWHLTEKGRGLFPVLVALRQWGEEYFFQPEEIRARLVDRDRNQPVPRLEVHASDGRALAPEDTVIAMLPGTR